MLLIFGFRSDDFLYGICMDWFWTFPFLVRFFSPSRFGGERHDDTWC